MFRRDPILSLGHDNVADTTTWTAIGSLIWPWQQNFSSDWWVPSQVAVAPSASFNLVNTNVPKMKGADSLLYRMGGYLSWAFPTPHYASGLELRAAGVYATDIEASARLPGYELDLEPRWQVPYLHLGYTHAWIQKEPTQDVEGATAPDTIVLATQLRVWLHAEGGDVQDNGKSWDPTPGSFFRIGPTVQFQLSMPRAILGNDLSLTVLYSHLSPTLGTTAHESYLNVSASYDLYKRADLNQKFALTAQYQKGGLNFTKEDVDTFTLGLGVLY